MKSVHPDLMIYDVAIIGYGPVGATLANLLGQEGLSVALLERESSIFHQPRAGHFDGEVMRVFQSIGCASQIVRDVIVNPGMKFLNANGDLLLDWPRPQEIGYEGWHASYRFHQPYLERELRVTVARFQNVDALLHCDAQAFEVESGHVEVAYDRIAEGRCRLRARYVVGCDGARSTVRRFMDTPMEDLKSHERWLVIDVVLKQPRPDLPKATLQWCDPKRPITMACGVGQRRRWEVMLMPGEDPDSMIRPESVWKVLTRWITPEEAEIERAVVYTFHATIAKQWRQGRLLLAGDACHQMPPFMGQGMCAGIRDASNLAWKLAAVLDGRTSDSILDTYQSEREPHVRTFIDSALRLGRLVQITDPEEAAVRDASFQSNPSIMQTPQPLLGPGLRAAAPDLAGTRAWQPRLEGGQLLDEAQGSHFGLLAEQDLIGSLRDAIDERDIRAFDEQHVQVKSYLTAAAVQAVVIRPDRYVLGAARSQTELRELLTLVPARRQPR
jgi:3-(3-hydroxy-phenyl)propionate hydroxylase